MLVVDYSIEYINKEIQELASEIREDVPYWMHNRPIVALKKALKKCNSLTDIALDDSVIVENKKIIQECLNIFKSK